jgi:hypothetical protein
MMPIQDANFLSGKISLETISWRKIYRGLAVL